MWMVLLSASAQATDTWTRREPASLAGIEAAPVGFASLLYRGEPGLLGAIEREPTDVVLSRLLSHEIPVAGAATPFGDPLPAGVVLGGTAHGVDFVRYDGELGWKAHVDWQLRDERTMQVLYETTTTGYVAADHGDDVASRAAHLLEVAVDQLAARPRFVEALAGVPVPPPPEPGVLRRCESPVASLPGDFKAAEAAVVEVIAGDVRGAGVIVSPDGWVITASHLLSGPSVQVRQTNGTPIDAEIVRDQPIADVALLRIPGEALPCLALAEGTDRLLGAPIWLVGNPLGEGLSVSAGIVSAHRVFDEVDHLQTDASASPGSSGGPALAADGTVVGVLVSKVVGDEVEGIAHTVSADAIRRWLAVDVGETSELAATEVPKVEPVVDPPDPPFPEVAREEVCVYRARMESGTSVGGIGGVMVITTAPSRYYVSIGHDEPMPLDHSEYVCRDVPVGTVPIQVTGGYKSFELEAGEPIAFVIGPPNWLIPKTQLPRARPKAWKRTRPKLMKAERD